MSQNFLHLVYYFSLYIIILSCGITKIQAASPLYSCTLGVPVSFSKPPGLLCIVNKCPWAQLTEGSCQEIKLSFKKPLTVRYCKVVTEFPSKLGPILSNLCKLQQSDILQHFKDKVTTLNGGTLVSYLSYPLYGYIQLERGVITPNVTLGEHSEVLLILEEALVNIDEGYFVSISGTHYNWDIEDKQLDIISSNRTCSNYELLKTTTNIDLVRNKITSDIYKAVPFIREDIILESEQLYASDNGDLLLVTPPDEHRAVPSPSVKTSYKKKQKIPKATDQNQESSVGSLSVDCESFCGTKSSQTKISKEVELTAVDGHICGIKYGVASCWECSEESQILKDAYMIYLGYQLTSKDPKKKGINILKEWFLKADEEIEKFVDSGSDLHYDITHEDWLDQHQLQLILHPLSTDPEKQILSESWKTLNNHLYLWVPILLITIIALVIGYIYIHP